MDVSSEVKQKPKRFKKNYGVSTISLATIIFWIPTAFVFIVKFYVGKNIPIWIAIISSVLCIILGIIDLEIGNMEKNNAYALSIDYINNCFYHCHSNMYCLHGYSSLC